MSTQSRTGESPLFDFADSAVAARFTAIDDRVMGGVSRSYLRADQGSAFFEGVLSSESNGGFASVRSARFEADLTRSRGLALRVRGDGRAYRVRLFTRGLPDGASYQASFVPPEGRWETFRLPFEIFRSTYRGRVHPDAPPLDPFAIEALGLLVADRQVGSFRLELAWIDAFRGP